MAELLDLIRVGSFNGAKFLVKSATTAGGRKQVKHQFPNSSKQAIEDLGFKPKTFSMVVETAQSFADGKLDAQSYFVNRDALISALEAGGVGTLSHPFFNTDLQLVAMPYTIEESTTNLGICVFNISFEFNSENTNPQSDLTSLSSINRKTEDVTGQFLNDIIGFFKVSTGFNLNSAASIMTSYFTSTVDNVQSIPVTTDKINQFASDIKGFQADVIGLVQDPTALGDAVITTIQSIRGLYSTADSALDAYLNFFDFGDKLAAINPTTQQRAERRVNQDLLTVSMQGAYLAQAYQAATVKKYTTVDDVDAIKKKLEDQFDKVIDGDISGDLRKTLQELRVISDQFLDDERITAKSIEPAFTNTRPLRALAFDYYGVDDNDITETLADLNNVDNLGFIEGDIQVISA